MLSHLHFVQKKIHTRETLAKQLALWRFEGKKIAFTNGCFDIVHLGHVESLALAADCGDVLVVGLNSDASVRLQGKSPMRPLQNEISRATVLASMRFVSAVIGFDELTPYELIDFIQPDVLVKGGDYKVEEIAGHDIVLKRGGEVKLIPLVQGYSTTTIENKIRAGA